MTPTASSTAPSRSRHVPWPSHPLTAPAAQVRPERLLARAETVVPRSALPARAARAAVTALLRRLDTGQLTIVAPDGSRAVYRGRTDGDDAEVHVLDDRAWTAVATEGSIGLGRGYIEGWWTTPDPVGLLQLLTRNLRTLDELRNRWQHATGGMTDRLRRVLPGPGRSANREDIASHYDLGNDFFSLFLDETMTYSAGVFAHRGADMATASRAKYDRLLAKLGVHAGTSLLEVGTGWGGLALRAAGSLGCPVTTTTISAEQRAEARRRVEAAGLTDRITVLDKDWRDLQGRFDRVVSIEMIEAVDWRHYDRFFATLDRLVAPDGLVGLQAICVPDRRYERAKKTEDFIRRFVFPGGNLPSIGSITRAVAHSTRLQILDVEDFSAHYAETLARWRTEFDAKIDEVRALGLDDRFCRLWRFYLAYCEAGFRERHCTVNQIILAGPRWRPDGLSLRPH
ncbi:MAG: cyclopropane-fatty-acyl-phospholipid synthase family protein [Acidimicrobiia bacterium]|nr:cyclopropane-fatty-acyl-phospholipid synthase family protein [Acidimicrobiia bacterium]